MRAAVTRRLEKLAAWSCIRVFKGETTTAIDLEKTTRNLSNTKGRQAKHRLFPPPVGREMNTSLPFIKLKTASNCFGTYMYLIIPKCLHRIFDSSRHAVWMNSLL